MLGFEEVPGLLFDWIDSEKLPRLGKKYAVPPSGLLRTAGDCVQ